MTESVDDIKARRAARRAAERGATKTQPDTEYALVRSPRVEVEPGKMQATVSIVKNDGTFDFTDYRFLRMSPSASVPVEEWVYKDELELYQRVNK